MIEGLIALSAIPELNYAPAVWKFPSNLSSWRLLFIIGCHLNARLYRLSDSFCWLVEGVVGDSGLL